MAIEAGNKKLKRLKDGELQQPASKFRPMKWKFVSMNGAPDELPPRTLESYRKAKERRRVLVTLNYSSGKLHCPTAKLVEAQISGTFSFPELRVSECESRCQTRGGSVMGTTIILLPVFKKAADTVPSAEASLAAERELSKVTANVASPSRDLFPEMVQVAQPSGVFSPLPSSRPIAPSAEKRKRTGDCSLTTIMQPGDVDVSEKNL